MFVKLTEIDKDGTTVFETWINKACISLLKRVSANADFVDHTYLEVGDSIDSQTFYVSETPEAILPEGTGIFRS